MIVVTGFDAARLAEEVSPVGGKFSHTDTVCLCNVRDDLIHTVVILNRFGKYDLEASVVSDASYIPRSFILSVYEYVFLYEGKNVMIMYTSVENERMNKIHEKMGHRYIGEIPGKFGDQDAILWIATPDILDRWRRKNFTFTRTKDPEILQSLLDQNNFIDEESKIILEEFLRNS